MCIEKIIGYDIRTVPGHLGSLDPSYVENYIVNDQAENVLSADTLIWPSFFDGSIQSNRWIGPNNGLWENINQMLDQSKGLNTDLCWLLAVTVVTDKLDSLIDKTGEIQTIASTLPDASVHLGYDVTDKYMLSILSNCMYTKEEIIAIKQSYLLSLNKYNLFDSPLDALSFCSDSAERVPEHMPCFCMGLHKLIWPL